MINANASCILLAYSTPACTFQRQIPYSIVKSEKIISKLGVHLTYINSKWSMCYKLMTKYLERPHFESNAGNQLKFKEQGSKLVGLFIFFVIKDMFCHPNNSLCVIYLHNHCYDFNARKDRK